MPTSSRPTRSRPWESLEKGGLLRARFDCGIAELPAIPVLAARGKVDGPRITVVGAVHGDEYEGTTAIQMLFGELQPEDLEELPGLLIGLPVANGAAWQAARRTTPQDGLDLNRAFPGDASPQAPPTRRLAHTLFQTFIEPADIVIDLHSGSVRLNHLPMIGWGEDDDGRAEALARVFGFDFFPWRVGATPGVLTHEATRAGKIAIGAEWGGGGSLDLVGAGAYAEGIRHILNAVGPTPPWDYEMYSPRL